MWGLYGSIDGGCFCLIILYEVLIIGVFLIFKGWVIFELCLILIGILVFELFLIVIGLLIFGLFVICIGILIFGLFLIFICVLVFCLGRIFLIVVVVVIGVCVWRIGDCFVIFGIFIKLYVLIGVRRFFCFLGSGEWWLFISCVCFVVCGCEVWEDCGINCGFVIIVVGDGELVVLIR